MRKSSSVLPNWFKNMLLQYKFRLCSLFFLLVSVGILDMITPIILQRFIDHVATNAAVWVLIRLAITFLVIALLNYLLKVLNSYYSNKITWGICEEIRVSCLKRMKQYDRAFEQQYSVGKLADYLTNDISEINNFITRTLLPTIIDVVTMLAIIVVVIKESVILGSLFVVYFSFAAFIIYKTQNKKSTVLGEERKVESEISSVINEIVLARKELQAMHAVNAFTKKLQTSMDGLFPFKLASQKYIYTIWIISLFFISFSNVLAIGVGGALYITGIVSLGTVYLVYNYSQQLKQPLETIQYHINNFLMVKQAVRRLSEIFDYKSSISLGNESLPSGLISVTVKQLRFQYDESKMVLEDINFSVRAGQSLGIIGVSGSGKSTLGLLLTKQMPCSNQSIYLSGVDINELNIADIRRNTCLMTMNDKLFEGSLKDNLTVYDDTISDQQVQSFIERYGFKQLSPYFSGLNQEDILHKSIDLQALSVGEKQLIHLFRLFFKPKKLIIFDEALSNIDERIEAHYFKLLKEISKESTLILITHNIERLDNCDSIIILEQGKIIAQDSSKKILEGLNTQMYSLSSLGGKL